MAEWTLRPTLETLLPIRVTMTISCQVTVQDYASRVECGLGMRPHVSVSYQNNAYVASLNCNLKKYEN